MKGRRAFRSLGFALILLGISVLIGSQLIFTGAFLGAPTLTVAGSLGGLLLTVSGFIMFYAGGAISRAESPHALGESLSKKHSDVLVLDTSFIFKYPGNLAHELEDMDEVDVYAPSSVLEEIGKGELSRGISKNIRRTHPDESCMRMARDYLERTAKTEFREKIIPIINGESEKPGTRAECAPLIREARKVVLRLDEKGLAVNRENLIGEFERSYKVSKADTEVLATAIYEAKRGKHVVIAELDCHLSQAVGKMKEERPYIGKMISCVEP